MYTLLFIIYNSWYGFIQKTKDSGYHEATMLAFQNKYSSVVI